MEAERFLKFLLVYMLTAVMADAFGTLLGTIITPVVSTNGKEEKRKRRLGTCRIIISNLNFSYYSSSPNQTGTFIGVISTAYMFMFSGFLVMFNHMPLAMQYVSRLSFKRYSMEALVLALYDNNRANMICPDEVPYCHYRSPKFLIKEMGMTPNNYSYDILMMVIMLVTLKVVTYFTLKRRLSNMLG